MLKVAVGCKGPPPKKFIKVMWRRLRRVKAVCSIILVLFPWSKVIRFSLGNVSDETFQHHKPEYF